MPPLVVVYFAFKEGKMTINKNPFYEIDNLVEMIKDQYTDPVAQALLEATIWERKGTLTMVSCVGKDQSTETYQNMMMRGEWMIEVAGNYYAAAIKLELMR
jgi:hypothetical protein